MKLNIIIFLLAMQACVCNKNKLQSVDIRCGIPCYTGPDNTRNIGMCHDGIWKCDNYGTNPVCIDEQLPIPEVCDGLDNNCNGSIDEGLSRPCTSKCGSGYEFCKNGQWVGCTAQQPKPQTCDGQDDDCDGKINDIPLEYCYDGPANTAGVGACHPGIYVCTQDSSGEWNKTCSHEVTPRPETCQDIQEGYDAACNGELNTNSNSHYPNIVVMVDNSSTMIQMINIAKNLFHDMTINGNVPPSSWSLIVSDRNSDQMDLNKNFELFSQFQVDFDSLNADAPFDFESSYYALDQVLNPRNALGLNWTPGSKVIILYFEDDGAADQRTNLTANDIVKEAHNKNAQIWVYTNPSYWDENSGSYDSVTVPTGGEEVDMPLDVRSMENQIINSIETSIVCL